MRLGQAIRRFFRRETGTASVEFVLTVPILMVIFMAAFESGLLMTRQILLEQSLDMTMRELRLGRLTDPTPDKIKNEICKRSIIFSRCKASTAIELIPVNAATWQMPATATRCRDRVRNIEPVVTFTPGAENELMMVRVCIVQDAMFPLTGIGFALPKDDEGGYGLVAVSAFVNEPS